MWKAIGKTLAGIGLPILGGALGGPAGAMVGKGLANALGLSDEATPEQVAAKVKDLGPDAFLALKEYEMDHARELAGMAIGYDQAQLHGQIDLAKIDQASGDRFRAGWRPSVGWICAFGLFYTFALRPLLPWVVKVIGMIGASTVLVPELPAIDMTELFVLLGGMLGLGGARTFEKVRGVKNGR